VGPVGRGLAWARRRPTAAGLVLAVWVAVVASAALGLSAAYGTRLRAAHQAEAEQRERVEGYLYFHRVALAGRALDENNVAQAERLLAECPEARRGWEWFYLKGQCRGGLLALSLRQSEGSGWSVRGVAYNGDGTRLAAVDGRGVALVWDPDTGREVGRVADDRATFGLAFAPDGRHLAVVGDGGASVWGLAGGAPSHTLKGDLVRGLAVAYSPDGRLIATGESVTDPPPVDTVPRLVRVWDAATGRLLRVLDGPPQDVLGLAFRPESGQLAAATGVAKPGTVPTRPGMVKVWALDTGREVFTATARGPLTGIAYSRDGRRLAAGGLDRTVIIWEANSGREETVLRRYAHSVLGVAWGCGGQLATAGEDGVVKVWDVDTDREVVTLRGHTGPVAGVAFRPDGKQLASAGWDQTVRIWDPTGDRSVTTLRGHTGPVTDAAVLPDGRIASTANPDRPDENPRPEVLIWDPSAPDRPLRLPTGPGSATGVAVSADGRRLAAAIDRRTHIWEIATGRELPAGNEFEGRVTGVVFVPDGREVAAAVYRREVVLRDTGSGGERQIPGGSCLFRVAVSPDGRWLAAPTRHYDVAFWDLRTGREEVTFRAHDRLVADVAFGPDGRSFATASWDGTAKVWGTTAACRGDPSALRLTLRGHAEPVLTVGFSPDGQRLATGGEDQTIKIWDTATGQEVLTLRGHTGAVTRVAFSADGRRVVSASRDGTLKVWEAARP
ncbi:MAG: (Myosin heavy-chain) kinase Histone acetyltransferase, partial [Gemmataceae bacterium]|nr:(Myosin heavy-chain) kinase Histone acetyltransferase [Gemmataceae bacterium]